MNTAVQDDFPLDLLGILGAGEHVERFAAAGTSPLVLREIVNHFLSRKLMATLSAITLRPRLFASLASSLVRP